MLQQFKAKLFHYNFNIQMAFKRSESEEICTKASRLAIVTIATQGSPNGGQTLLTCLKKVSASVCLYVSICECVWESLLHYPPLKCLPCLANCFGNLFNRPGQIELGMKTFLSGRLASKLIIVLIKAPTPTSRNKRLIVATVKCL